MSDLSNWSKMLIQELATQVRGYAKEAGTACDLPRCKALTLGVRCESCLRRTCLGHTYWNTPKVKPLPYCPFCVVSINEDLFAKSE